MGLQLLMFKPGRFDHVPEINTPLTYKPSVRMPQENREGKETEKKKTKNKRKRKTPLFRKPSISPKSQPFSQVNENRTPFNLCAKNRQGG